MLRLFLKPTTTNIKSVFRRFPVITRNAHIAKTRIQRLHHDGIDYNRQSVEIDHVEHIYRCTFYKDADIWTLYKTICPNVRTLGDTLYEGRTASNDGPCVGTLQKSNTIDWLSYSKVIERSRLIGSYLWTTTNLTPNESKVAIMSLNRPEYLFIEQACYMYGFVLVNLYTSYEPATVMNLLERTTADVLVIDDIERIRSYQNQLLKNDRIKKIIVMNGLRQEENSKIQSLSSILKAIKADDIRKRPTIDPDSIATLIMTSGTTGDPKISMLSHENLLAASKGNILRTERANLKGSVTVDQIIPQFTSKAYSSSSIGDPKISMLSHENLLAASKGNILRTERANLKGSVTVRHCSVLPLAHIFERFILLGVLLRGNQVVFCPQPEKLLEYFAMVKPTQVTVVPRILNKIYDGIMLEVGQSKLKQYLVQQALRSTESNWFSRLIFRKVKNLFGDELKAVFVGAAPITRDVLHFYRIALDIPVMTGYGQTESTACATSTHAGDTAFDVIGSPVATVEIKLIDVPNTNYQSHMNQGEICIRGPVIFEGYYDDEVKTGETIDEKGWLHTGDVGEWASNGALRIIDRTKHIFKLNQGTYIAPERLEDIYLRSQWVAQIFIDGISTEATVVAIVVPDEEYVQKHFKPTESIPFAAVCKDEQLKRTILSDLIRLAKDNKLKYFETVSNIHLHPEPFSVQNGLLTITLKTRRQNVQTQFRPLVQSLYDKENH
ncbi:unnamed protein product [Adineta ricciae]|uniref:long-chain-fatty-acid--CoA ligase n=1 Tax=Adineta ricciae TaxID=249248 RepID=A0A814UDF5_ADIRI|nr:unnamed protein product [Adineta ricciae]